MKVNFTDKDYDENIADLDTLNDLYEGSRAIKSKGTLYLDPFELETDDVYKIRLNSSDFQDFFKETINVLSSVLLRKEIKLDYKVRFESYIKNIDGQGSSVNVFIKRLARTSLIGGMSYIWVDNQRIKSQVNMSSIDTIKPFFKLVDRRSVLSKKIEVENGLAVLKQVVIKQTINEEIDDFETIEKDIYIVLKENEGIIFEEEKNGPGFIEIDRWDNALGFVPLIPVYSDKKGFLESGLPLFDLGKLNLSHYNSLSDYKSITKHAVPVPVIHTDNEFDKNTLKKDGLIIGVKTALVFGDKTKEGFSYVEITGSSVHVVTDYIKQTENKMEKSALSIISSGTFNTATEAKIVDNNNNLFLTELAYSIEEGMNKAFEIMSLYAGQTIDVSVELSKDFSSIGLDANQIDKYISLKEKGYISMETLWDNLKKGEVINIEDYDLEKQKISDDNNAL